MFKKTTEGFSIEANGYLVEVNFGPNSASDNRTVSRKAFEAQPYSPDAEIIVKRIGQPGTQDYKANASPADLAHILSNLTHNVE